MKTDEIRGGGLFRCCLDTIEQHPTPGQEGETIVCHNCNDRICFREGAWEWHKAQFLDNPA